MKILIATPLLPTQPGGPGQYGHQLAEALKTKGHTVTTIDFQKVRKFPTGIRHLFLCVQLFKSMRDVDIVISLDTVSIALPSVITARLRGVRNIVRVGGDFVWEHFVERTKQKIKLSEFYTTDRPLSLKESLLMWLQKRVVLRFANTIVFSTAWQKDIWLMPYGISSSKVRIVENAYVPMSQQKRPQNTSKCVVWIGRDLVLKNIDILDIVINEVQKEYPEIEFKKYSNISHTEVISALQNSRMLVIPSVSEVSPNIVFEAFACSVPVLLTDDCGLHEVLQGKVVWIDALNSTDISKKIGLLLKESEYAKMVSIIQQQTYNRTYADVADDFLRIIV